MYGVAYADDRSWSDSYLGHVIQILAPYVFHVSNLTQDRNEATDLITNALKFNVRLRRSKSASRYPNQITLRSATANGQAKPELDKVLDGAADIMFYGIVEEDHKTITYKIIDLAKFRLACKQTIEGTCVFRSGQIYNEDGSAFTWFDLSNGFPKGTLIDEGVYKWTN